MMLVADVPPVVTPAGKPVRVRVTTVPPLAAREVGEIAVSVGAGTVLLIFPGGFASVWVFDAGA